MLQRPLFKNYLGNGLRAVPKSIAGNDLCHSLHILF